jgi:mannose-6-phosphate isomerase-like protein (cupin superfamily)
MSLHLTPSRNRSAAARVAGALFCLWSLCGPASAVGQDTDQKLSASELEGLVAKPTDGRASANFWKGAGYIVQASLRLKQGEVEVHAITSDLFIVQEGGADLTLGGAVEGGRDTAPNERRGGAISGGHVRSLAVGDVLWIPAGQPHQVTPRDGGFRYLVVKMDVRPGA